MIKIILLAIVLLIASFGTAAAEDAPAMWMVQEGDTIKLMVNTSADSAGVEAHINFDATQINITDVDISMSPWIALADEGWSNQGDHIIIALMDFTGIVAGEYTVAVMDVECLEYAGDTAVTITDVVVLGNVDLIASGLTYVCPVIDPPATDAVVSIGDGTGVITLPITVTGAGDAGACDVTLTYNPASVTVTAVATGDMEYTYINVENIATGSVRIGAYQGVAPGLDDFTLASVVLAPVEGGSTCDLTLTVTELTDSTPTCADIPYTISSGIYTIVATGDIDGDGELTLGDAAYIAGYVIGMPGCGTINEELADVNGDGVVTIADAMYLAKCVLGVPGFTL